MTNLTDWALNLTLHERSLKKLMLCFTNLRSENYGPYYFGL